MPNIDDIAAAMASPEIRKIASLLASAAIKVTGRMTIAEVDQKLSASRLTNLQRIEVKTAMHRANLIAS